MNVAINIDSIDKRNIIFYDPVENKVMVDSVFVQSGYSNELFTISGIYINTNFIVSRVDKYFKKHKYTIDISSNNTMIDNLIKIEKMILEILDRPELTKIYKLKEQMIGSSLTVFEGNSAPSNSNHLGEREFILKISGVWITENSCGITFKFFHIND